MAIPCWEKVGLGEKRPRDQGGLRDKLRQGRKSEKFRGSRQEGSLGLIFENKLSDKKEEVEENTSLLEGLVPRQAHGFYEESVDSWRPPW